MDAKAWSMIAAEHAVQSLRNARLVKEDDVPRVLEIITAEVHHRFGLCGEPQPVVSKGEWEDAALAREIARTLQALTFVSRLSVHFPVSKRGFWERCRLLTTFLSQPTRIYVDGFVAACKWNSWQVFAEARETGLSLWSGYAYLGHWTAHTWCMLGERFVETGGPFRIYYGAELNASEIEELGKEFADFPDSAAKKGKLVWTMVNGEREAVRYNEAEHGQSIGRERDPKTGAIRDGLGR